MDLDDSFITIYEYPLDHMAFSNCGNFLHGVRIGHPRQGEPVFLHLGPQLSCVPPQITNPNNPDNCHRDLVNSVPTNTASQILSMGSKTRASINNMPISTTPEFSDFQGQLQISALAQDKDRGSVMLQTIRADGKVTEETITRLPKLSTLEKSYSTLVPAASHKNLRLVLNMAIQDTYDADAVTDFQLPAVLDREKSSVPAVVYTAENLLGPSQKRQKRRLDSGPLGTGNCATPWETKGTPDLKKRR
jgi:hypothetical protein